MAGMNVTTPLSVRSLLPFGQAKRREKMITETRYKEICREEGATEAAAEEYWQFELVTRKVVPHIDSDNEEIARQTIQSMLVSFPEDYQKED